MVREHLKNDKGYSLVELIIVIAIIVALAASALLSITMIHSARAKDAAVKLGSEVNSLKTRCMNMTPDNTVYDFYALAVVSAFHKAYNILTDNSEWLSYIRDNSVQYTEIEYSDNDRFIALSTCASDFENARALFTGKLVPIA